jgi:hypothetical protein
MRIAILIIFLIFWQNIDFSFGNFAVNEPESNLLLLDTMGQNRWRSDLQNGWRSPHYGLQIHQSCYQDSPLNQVDSSLWPSVMESVLDELFEQVNNCSRRFPEFTPYLFEWISQARRSVIICADPNPKSLYAAVNYFDVSNFDHLNSINEPHLVSSNQGLPLNFETLIDTPFPVFFHLPHPALNSMIFHEILHSTSANHHMSHNNHNDLITDPSNENFCTQESIGVDRIYLIQSLCFDENLVNSQIKAEEFLNLKIQHCGGISSCSKIFHQDIRVRQIFSNQRRQRRLERRLHRLYQEYSPISGMPQYVADNLCGRIQNPLLFASEDLVFELETINEQFKPICPNLETLD